ncbi:MAG: metallophosphoesterase [bacterium]
MKVGIIADTHDHLPNLRKFLERFSEAGVERVLHAGDLIAPFVFLEFEKYKLPFTAVFGNNDGEVLFLAKLAENRGDLKKGPVELELSGRKIILMHEPVVPDALADSGHFDLVVYGHTHATEERKKGNALVLNPGEACGYLSGRSTAMVCDLADLSVETLEL